jgi:hypothetical protein
LHPMSCSRFNSEFDRRRNYCCFSGLITSFSLGFNRDLIPDSDHGCPSGQVTAFVPNWAPWTAPGGILELVWRVVSGMTRGVPGVLGRAFACSPGWIPASAADLIPGLTSGCALDSTLGYVFECGAWDVTPAYA